MRLTFYGGAKMVTGANYLLESGSTRILVDCGLHQGSNFCEKHNWEPFLYDPKTIDAVLVTHAHIDHTGRLPKLMKEGFRGKVYSTLPTKDFSRELLLDSEHVLMQEAEKLKKPPLYGVREVEELMARWEGIEYHTPFNIGPFIVTFFNAGHILGSSFILVEGPASSHSDPALREKNLTKILLRQLADQDDRQIIQSNGRVKIVFSGDLGNSPAPIIGLREAPPSDADYCLVESAYGDRIHEDVAKRKEMIEDLIEDTVKNGGTLMIPAFAMERTQELLFEINELAENGRIPRVPIFIDSPLAIKLTEVYKNFPKYFDAETRAMISRGDSIFSFPGLKMTLTTDQSKKINDVSPPKVIIAGSGMSHGGRILHHEKRYLPDPKSTLLIIGYQAAGSMGRRILDGADSVKIFGEEVAVRCRVKAIGGYSAHADQPQLLDWLKPIRSSLTKVFVVQGEEKASVALAQLARDELAVEAVVPDEGMSVEL